LGALFNNVCYPTQDAARASVCSQFDAKVMQSTNLYTSECTSTVVTGATMTICKRTNGGACTNVSPPWPVTPVCEVFAPDQFGITPADMSYVYAWGVSAVLALFMVGYAIGAGLTAIKKV
jgi:hypothetical protein